MVSRLSQSRLRALPTLRDIAQRSIATLFAEMAHREPPSSETAQKPLLLTAPCRSRSTAQIATAATFSSSALAIASADGGSGPVAAAVELVCGLQKISGLPWWATLTLTAIGVRCALMPLTIQQLRSSTANIPLMQQAAQRSGQQPRAVSGQSVNRLQSWLAEFHLLRRQKKAPSPVWIVATPLLQIPVFLTAVLAVRRMASLPWPGFEAGGLFWFVDLTLPAMSLDTVAAPMGSSGIVLPAAVAGLMMANLNQAFARTQHGKQSLLGPQWLMGTVRLGLEWLTLPLFLIAMQLPQAVLVYWTTSSAVALVQAQLLRSAALQMVLGLQRQATPKPTMSMQQQPILPDTELAEADVEAALQRCTTDVAALFQQAAEWRANGQRMAAVKALERIIHLDPSNSRAWFALGQTLSGMKQWALAEHAYTEAALHETDTAVRARAWLGAGIAACNGGDPEAGITALRKASDTALSAFGEGMSAGPRIRTAAPMLFTAGRLQRPSGKVPDDLSVTAVRALLSQGAIFKQQRQLDNALEVVDLAVRLDSQVASVRSSLLAELEKQKFA